MTMEQSIIVFAILSFACVCAADDSGYVRMPDLFGLDEYESCLQDVKGVYCVAQFELFANDTNGLMNSIKEHSEDTARHYNYSYIDRGICVTETCKQYTKNIDIEKAPRLAEVLEKCFNDLIWEEYKINASLRSAYSCDRHGESEGLDMADWAVAGLLIALVALCLIGSCYDISVHRQYERDSETKVHKYLLCFSMFQNIKSLTWNDKDVSHESLKGLHGIRTLIMGLVVCAHIVIIIYIYNKNPHTIEKMYDCKIYSVLFNGLMVVQVFFFLSGFMFTYLLEMQAESLTIGWSMVPKVIAMRWFRLTPTCAVMIAVTASWARHLGSGPLWKTAMTHGVTAQCRAYWWSHLLYVNNMVPDNTLCLFQTWHIAADMQMFVVGLVVHVATRSRGRILALVLLLVCGMLAPAVPVWLYGYDAFHMAMPEFLRTLSYDTFQYVHVRGYMNLPCYVLGMVAGYLGHDLQKRGTDLSKYTTLKFLSWWINPLIVGVIYAGRPFYMTDLRASVLARMAYAVTHRATLGVLCAALVLAMICRCNAASSALFSWRGWVVTSKLSYCVYIVHSIFFHVFLGLRRELTDYSFFDVIPTTIAVLAASYILAVPMYLMIELPFSKIVNTRWKGSEVDDKKTI